ncbi:MAG TPA: amino acid permease, partial [Longimicrobium sp.]|nr:amino acid permease [Longimicrobium sp.]
MDPTPAAPAAAFTAPQLARRLGLFDATMIVMGGIVGSGIFVAPCVVARHVHTPALIVGAWLAGGLIALAGAFVYAELAARRPHVGGQYAYLRDAYHPAVAFVYGWALLLVIQTGGMAAVAVTFARYFREVTQVPLGEPVIAGLGIALLAAVNCMGVRSGGTVQNTLMVLKIVPQSAQPRPDRRLCRRAPRLGCRSMSDLRWFHPLMFAASLMWTGQLAAQDRGMVTGVVVDATTGAPMPRVHVAAGERRNTLTDDDGRFALCRLQPG